MTKHQSGENNSATVDCPACRGNATSPKISKIRIPLRRCQDCGLIFIYPPPTLEELLQLYQEDYYDSWGGEELENVVNLQKKSNFQKHLGRIKEQIPSGSILDVGCAKGHFVDLALSNGFDAYGVEISSYSGSIASQKVGAERIHSGTLEDAPFKGKKFNAVTMFDLLEHVPDLHGTLSTVFSRLHPGGLLYIVTPNTRSLSHRIMGKDWWHYKREHLYYFDELSLGRLLEKHGFTTINTGSSPKHLSLEYLFQQLTTYPAPFITPVSKVFKQYLPSQVRIKTLTLPSGEMFVLSRRQQN